MTSFVLTSAWTASAEVPRPTATAERGAAAARPSSQAKLIPAIPSGASQVQKEFADLCDANAAPIENAEVFSATLGHLRDYLLVAPVLPGYPDACLLAAPSALSVRATLNSINPQLERMRRYDFGSEIVWGFAGQILALERAGQPSVGLETSLTASVATMYPDRPDLNACVRDEMSFAAAFVHNVLVDPAKASEMTPLLKPLNDDGRDACRNRWGRGELGADARNWIFAARLESDLVQAETDGHAADRAYNAISNAALFGGLDGPALRFALRRQMATKPLLVPTDPGWNTPIQNAQASAKALFHLSLRSKAGDGEELVRDLDLGSEAREHKEPNQWLEAGYGSVTSQADAIIDAGEYSIGHPSGERLWQFSLSSVIVGGYDPPWPSREFPTRGKQNHTSGLDATLEGRFSVPACPTMSVGCDPKLGIIIALPKDNAALKAGAKVTLTQSGEPAAIWQDQFGRLRADLDTSRGPVDAVVTLARKDTQSGADAPDGLRQVAQVTIVNGPAGADPGSWQGSNLAEWFASLPSGNRPVDDVDFFAQLGRWKDANREYFEASADLYSGYLVPLLLAETVQRIDLSPLGRKPDGGRRLTDTDRERVARSRVALSLDARLRYLDATKQGISDLKGLASAVDTGPLDLAIGSLLEASPAASAKLLARLGEFLDAAGSVLDVQDRARVRRVLATGSADGHPGPMAEKLVTEALVELMETRRSVTEVRRRLRGELMGRVVDLARLSQDCHAVIEDYSRILGQPVTFEGVMKC